MIPTDIPAAIRALRDALGWSRDRLATRIGVRPAMLAAYERGARPGARELYQLSLAAAELGHGFFAAVFHFAFAQSVGMTPENFTVIAGAIAAGCEDDALESPTRPRLVRRARKAVQ